jgi:hypothetical protein
MAKQGAQPQQELDESVEYSTVQEAVDPSDTGGAEETDMATRQIKAMRHYLDGIEERVKQQGDMEEWFQNKLTKANDYLKSLYGYGKGDEDDEKEDELDEKTLTPAEKKKREEIAKAIERENPKMPMDKKMAIATAQAKKVAESTVSDRTKALIERAINRKT